MESSLRFVAGEERRETLHRAGIEAAAHALAHAFACAGKRVAPEAIAIIKDARGKPHASVLDESGSAAVSISHAHPFVLGAASLERERLLGADIEPVRDSILRVSDAFLTDKESAAIQEHSETERVRFTTLAWVVKEAVLKALGTGLRLHPRRVDVHAALRSNKIPKEEARLPISISGRAVDATWQPIEAPEGFVAAAVLIPSNSAILELSAS